MWDKINIRKAANSKSKTKKYYDLNEMNEQPWTIT